MAQNTCEYTSLKFWVRGGTSAHNSLTVYTKNADSGVGSALVSPKTVCFSPVKGSMKFSSLAKPTSRPSGFSKLLELGRKPNVQGSASHEIARAYQRDSAAAAGAQEINSMATHECLAAHDRTIHGRRRPSSALISQRALWAAARGSPCSLPLQFLSQSRSRSAQIDSRRFPLRFIVGFGAEESGGRLVATAGANTQVSVAASAKISSAAFSLIM